MARCKCGREITALMQTRSDQHAPLPETLKIRINEVAPAKLVPGTAVIYCYWRISLHIDITDKPFLLFVPPEWRHIEKERLNEWTAQLRTNPLEDVTLGQTQYEWRNDILMPQGQRYATVPIPGTRGWPELDEPVPEWHVPLKLKGLGRHLPIAVNRRYISPTLGMGKLICYWRVALDPPGYQQRFIYVPPEWRRLSQRTRDQWLRRASVRLGQEIHLGGITYRWYLDTLMPLAQKPDLLEYMGKGQYSNVEDEESHSEEEITSEALDLAQKRTAEDMEVEHYSLQGLLEVDTREVPSNLSLRSISGLEEEITKLEHVRSVALKESAE